MPLETVKVENMTQLLRAFNHYNRSVAGEIKKELGSAAEPVRVDAQSLAISQIRRMTVPWSEMRVGVTTTAVYVAPRSRGVKARGNQRLRRPNLATLLRDRAMIPARDRNRNRVVRRVDQVLLRLGRKWERDG